MAIKMAFLFKLFTTISVFLSVFTTSSATENFFAKAECPLTVGDRPTDGHERWRDCEDCHSYKYATSGSGLQTGTCPSGLKWNWRLDPPNCDIMDECDNCIESCEDKELDTGRRWRSCTNCSQYIECTSSEGMVVRTCGPNLYFNYRLAVPECDVDSSVCDTLTRICGNDCSFNVNRGIRRLADCSFCNKYMTCLGKTAVKHTCGADLGYSLMEETCYNITEADCRDRRVFGKRR